MAKKSRKDAGKKDAGKKAKSGGATASAGVMRGAEIAARQETFSHPWNPNSEIIGVRLAKAMGLKRVAVSIVRIPQGKESYVPHAHQREEEWVYVLMGEAKALIGEDEIDVGAGDFLAYPAPQQNHHLRNVGTEDLVYLVGGEFTKMDVVDFPTFAKRAVRVGDMVTIYPTDAGETVTMPKSAQKAVPAEKKSKKKSKRA